MVGKTPKVSIGLAVFNGEPFLEEAIQSILAQTFTDFELIISDNASTDRTNEICQHYLSRDSRISYHRNQTNIGGGNNGNLTLRMARGEYFRWAAHDDICAPQLLEKCVDVLDKHPDVVLCDTIVTEIDEHGKVLRVINPDRGTFHKPHERFRALASWGHDCENIYGLARSDILRRTPLLLNYTDSDRTLLAELSLYGRFHEVPETLFYRRIHPNNSTRLFPNWRARMAWFNPGPKDPIVFPSWQQFFHYLSAIARAPIDAAEKSRCYRYMLRWLLLDHHGRMMAEDLAITGKQMMGISGKG